MLLSMVNISDGLCQRGYTVSAEVQITRPTLRCVRLLLENPDENDREADVAYIGASNAFISGEFTGTIICCQNDVLFIEKSEPEVIFNECSRIFDYYNRWELQLMQAVIDDKPLDHFMEMGHQVFQSPMFISSVNDQTYAITSQYGPEIHPVWKHRLEEGNLNMVLVTQNHESEYFNRCFASKYPIIIYSPIWKGDVIYCNLWDGPERIGAIMAYEYGHPFREGDVHLMYVYGKIIEKKLRLHPQQFFPLSELENILRLALNRLEVNWEQAETVLSNHCWDPHHRYRCLYVESFSGQNSMVLARARDILRNKINGICTIMYKTGVMILLNLNIQSHETESVIKTFRSLTNGKLVFGSSLDFFVFSEVEVYSRQAVTAAQLAREESTESLTFESVYGTILPELVCKDEELRTMIHPDILRLSQIDRQNGTHYCKTLYAYLLCGCNYREASGYLSIHRNTMLYRIERIRELLQSDLESIEYRQILLSSLLLNKGFLL